MNYTRCSGNICGDNMLGSETDIIRKIAFSMTKGTNATLVRTMVEEGLTLNDFFDMDIRDFSEAVGFTMRNILLHEEIENALIRAAEEAKFTAAHHIAVHSIFDEDFPARLAECPDSPTILYSLGDASLSPKHCLAVVGTRRPTPYGVNFCKDIVSDLASNIGDITTVSGLAYGIDATAHQQSIDSHIPTIAVLAHGLHMIYPAAHRDLAKRILKGGGALISEYPSGVKPFRRNFLERNRIVAGITDATLVVESDIKGGAMSTSSIAFSYNREVFALPGRISDTMSTGCNALIQRNKAALITCASDIISDMNWGESRVADDANEKSLFEHPLSPVEQNIMDIIKGSNSYVSIDEIGLKTSLPTANLLTLLLDLEMSGLIAKAPGNRYVAI